MKTITILEEQHLERVDKIILTHFPEVSRSEVARWFSDELVTLNGKIVKKNRKAQTDEVFQIEAPIPKEGHAVEPIDMNLDIAYEDDDLLVVNKAKGVVVHPGSGITNGTLVSGLLFHCKDKLSTLNGEFRPGIVHRLDKDTSGLMVVAKNDQVHSKLSSDLEKRDIKRIYHCLVWGHPSESEGTIDQAIGRNLDNRLLMKISAKGRRAVSHYKVLEYFDFASLVEVRLETGRTHQIRVHMNHIDCPVIGDPSYRGREYSLERTGPMDRALAIQLLKNCTSQALQAKELHFEHPVTKEAMAFHSDLHGEFATLLNMLQTSAKTQFE